MKACLTLSANDTDAQRTSKEPGQGTKLETELCQFTCRNKRNWKLQQRTQTSTARPSSWRANRAVDDNNRTCKTKGIRALHDIHWLMNRELERASTNLGRQSSRWQAEQRLESERPSRGKAADDRPSRWQAEQAKQQKISQHSARQTTYTVNITRIRESKWDKMKDHV